MAEKPRVLVADDEHVIADTFSTILSQNGYETAAVYCGDDAVNLAITFVPHLALLGFVMPGIDGAEAGIRQAD